MKQNLESMEVYIPCERQSLQLYGDQAKASYGKLLPKGTDFKMRRKLQEMAGAEGGREDDRRGEKEQKGPHPERQAADGIRSTFPIQSYPNFVTISGRKNSSIFGSEVPDMTEAQGSRWQQGWLAASWLGYTELAGKLIKAFRSQDCRPGDCGHIFIAEIHKTTQSTLTKQT
ncbi:hypothetical protein AAES_120672 [Amazona aestiva]|uniref:Uncharacterized protein n=1 Tax=Amazona aestiva TaxID=12930 RepID=A0A0Q3M607_AMAAE|nr:hypothetical protein AAES_120672 [Amazona aestiva]